ncbi:hypothetical protein [Arthrobacter sp. 92]|uniref:hypothetical protein n=1 Tax=Arthrobacter sp. 92 TaxID=3418175 RepID=UPI003D006DE5
MERIGDGATDAQVDAVLRAANVLLRVVAQSVVEVEDVVTSPQLRVRVLIATRGPQNPGAVATHLGVHPSNSTRICDRLVNAVVMGRAPEELRGVAAMGLNAFAAADGGEGIEDGRFTADLHN